MFFEKPASLTQLRDDKSRVSKRRISYSKCTIFGDVRFDPAPNFIEVETDAFIDAEVFATSIGVSFDQLSADNPALRPIVWEGNKRIPRGYPIKVRQDLVDESNLLSMIPVDYKFAVQTPDIAYVVERGDSLSLIANRFNTSVNRLVALNQLPSRHRIQIGQRILLPQDDIDPELTSDILAAVELAHPILLNIILAE